MTFSKYLKTEEVIVRHKLSIEKRRLSRVKKNYAP